MTQEKIKAPYTVFILSYENDAHDEGYRKFDCQSKRKAEKIEGGIMINLNHDKYYTLITSTIKGDEYYG